jgi:RimJ/RimL family protein N-acetyltransferase
MRNDHMVTLRAVEPGDIAIFYDFQVEPGSAEMVGMPTRERAAYEAYWQRNLQNPTNVTRTIAVDDVVAGYIASFDLEGERGIGYWIGQAFWGRGVATAAVHQFVHDIEHRELMAHVAKHNIGSLRVLQNNTFLLVGEDDEVYMLHLAART